MILKATAPPVPHHLMEIVRGQLFEVKSSHTKLCTFAGNAFTL